MTKAQVIHDGNGNPAFAVIPGRGCERLAAAGIDARLSASRNGALNSL